MDPFDFLRKLPNVCVTDPLISEYISDELEKKYVWNKNDEAFNIWNNMEFTGDKLDLFAKIRLEIACKYMNLNHDARGNVDISGIVPDPYD